MLSVVSVGSDGQVQPIRVGGVADIAELIGDTSLETLSSPDVVYWFARTQRDEVNLRATELFVVHTALPVGAAPLLWGTVVVTSRTSEGRVAGLSAADLTRLTAAELGSRSRIRLWRRCVRAERRGRQRAWAMRDAAIEHWLYGAR